MGAVVTPPDAQSGSQVFATPVPVALARLLVHCDQVSDSAISPASPHAITTLEG
jgi:hypothetical protein